MDRAQGEDPEFNSYYLKNYSAMKIKRVTRCGGTHTFIPMLWESEAPTIGQKIGQKTEAQVPPGKLLETFS